MTYNGNTSKISRRISENFTMNINVTGQDIIDSNIFSATISLKTELENNNGSGIANLIETLDSAQGKMISLNASIGSIQQQLDLAESRLNIANLNLSGFLSEAEDVDLAEAITKYNSEEMAYQAALHSTSDILRLNIMDFLR